MEIFFLEAPARFSGRIKTVGMILVFKGQDHYNKGDVKTKEQNHPI
jgi:hypothetical protein